MKTNKLPKSEWTDTQAAGSQSQQSIPSSDYRRHSYVTQQTKNASNDASYSHKDINNERSDDEYSDYLAEDNVLSHKYSGYKSADQDSNDVEESAMNRQVIEQFNTANGYKRPKTLNKDEPLISGLLDDQMSNLKDNVQQDTNVSSADIDSSYKEIPERVFMNGLIKHTGIALAIIIPLAAFSAYAATPPVDMATTETSSNAMSEKTTTDMLSIKPSDIIYKSTNTPTTVDNVDLNSYAGTWYEVGRLPMYFQRKCAGDVTANYTQKTDGSGIIVTNKCMAADGSDIVAEGLAKPVDDSGSKLKVTFLPKWIRWIPVGRADYWVLARDEDYKTALVGTPDKKYLWLLARSPNISQETYAKYRQIAQQQGYDLKEFMLTSQTDQTVNLVP
ncbi:lipocalin family protein [Psychrobacter sp. PP-21]|uniref:lipocalin family protein n=1 Tax=Psychrobacter sp. PP-21 TaxID=2957503 RepID=UPI0029AB05E5|nr:lipocalin family protein [Psychrobacter sp. PP-21]MDX2372709.1 lipocalin family protein [Psychrobacter sp. PP-21]